MRVFKVVLKSVATLVLVTVLILMATISYAIRYPEKAWQVAEKHFLPADLRITWAQLAIEPSLIDSWFSWSVRISSVDFCLRKEKPFMDICADRIKFKGELSWRGWKGLHIELDKAELISTHKNIFRPEPVTPTESEPTQVNLRIFDSAESLRQTVREYTKKYRVQNLNLQVDEFSYGARGTAPFILKGQAQSQATEKFSYAVQVHRAPDFKLESKGQIFLQAFLDKREQILDVSARLELPDLKAELPRLALRWKTSEALALEAEARAAHGTLRYGATTEMALDAQNLEGVLAVHIDGLPLVLKDISKPKIRFSLAQVDDATLKFAIASKFRLFFVSARVHRELEAACRCQIPQALGLDIKGDFDVARYFEQEDGGLGDVQLELENLSNGLFTSRSQLKGRLTREDSRLRTFGEVDFNLIVHSFQGLAIFLNSQRVMVPAPFANLQGPIEFRAGRAGLQNLDEKIQIPLSAKLNLTSPKQKVDIGAEGEFLIDRLKRTLDLNAAVEIRDFFVQLPTWDPLYGVPRLVPDKRFELKPKASREPGSASETAFTFRTDIRVKTTRSDSLHVFLNLAKPYIPLGMDLRIQSDEPFSGQVQIGKFDIEYLRRRSTVERFTIDLTPPPAAPTVKGRMRVDQTHYVVYIDVVGPMNAPQFYFSSVPDLSKDEIISVLLYDRTSDQLVSGDRETVGSFQAAVADRAIGLLGIWALANTPIRSFSYNQMTKQYTADLRLGDDTTLSIGTTWDQSATVAVQRRLSRRWIVKASVEPTEENEQTQKLRLQWEKRF